MIWNEKWKHGSDNFWIWRSWKANGHMAMDQYRLNIDIILWGTISPGVPAAWLDCQRGRNSWKSLFLHHGPWSVGFLEHGRSKWRAEWFYWESCAGSVWNYGKIPGSISTGHGSAADAVESLHLQGSHHRLSEQVGEVEQNGTGGWVS